MINTYQSSMAAPPVPPRLHGAHQGSHQGAHQGSHQGAHQGAHPVLIPTPLLPQGPSRTLLRLLVALVLLNLLLSILGFFYLYKNGKEQVQQDMHTLAVKAGPEVSMQKQDKTVLTQKASPRVFARMVFRKPKTPPTSEAGPLEWDLSHSRYSRPHVNYYNKSWLTIEEPGDYFVYSRVTFSKGHNSVPLSNRVRWRKSWKDEPKDIMQAFCHVGPSLCTATAEDVIKVERGNQLSVWTEDMSLVRYDENTTVFGLYNLW